MTVYVFRRCIIAPHVFDQFKYELKFYEHMLYFHFLFSVETWKQRSPEGKYASGDLEYN
jgi:hypothetical protein